MRRIANAMEKLSPRMLGAALFFDIFAFGLALGAMAKRSTARPTYAEPGYLTCGYTKDVSTGLAASAFVFLLFGQVLSTGYACCIYCGKPTQKSGFSRVCTILFLILSWLSFVIAELFLLIGAIVNSIRTKGQLDVGVVSEDENFCRQTKKAIFAVGAAFTFLTMIFSIGYIFQAKTNGKEREWHSYRGEADPYTDHEGPSMSMTAYH